MVLLMSLTDCRNNDYDENTNVLSRESKTFYKRSDEGIAKDSTSQDQPTNQNIDPEDEDPTKAPPKK